MQCLTLVKSIEGIASNFAFLLAFPIQKLLQSFLSVNL